MSYPEYDEQDYEEQPENVVTAPAPVQITAPWQWSASTLLWVAGGVLAASFAVWFLMSFNKAKTLAALEAVTPDGTQ
jgi:hypothetical protein